MAATLQAGNVVILVQPPRGFGENPIAIYHDPDLAPSHHYLAVYRWIEREFGAHAVVHVGKHGNLEWLPGKTLGMSASCGTDAAIGSLPLIYPFLVNDPGEGTQAKRRAHATIIDHLVPPMARAESYGDIARLEQLLDEYGNVSVMDPAKAPALRGEIWTLIQAAQLHQDLGLEERPGDEQFDEFVMHVDGWLCEIKDVQIRDGLHVLGQAPTGDELINLVLAVLRSNQVFGGQVSGVPGLRSALRSHRGRTDRRGRTGSRPRPRRWSPHWRPPTGTRRSASTPDRQRRRAGGAAVRRRRGGAAAAADHRRDQPRPCTPWPAATCRPGPSGSPLRGLVNVLPTGRNFYSVDPKAIPSRLAFQTGQSMADSLLRRHLDDTGEYPRSVGLSVWGTSAMRTSGDDIAEVFALLGVLPVWDDASRRVVGLEAVDLDELARPRIDVTVRISGFFRDAFPHVVAMIDDAVRLVAERDEPLELNYVRAHAQADLAEHGDQRRATTRIFGSKPGSYGAGILPLMEAGNWRDDQDLAEVYSTWGGFAYGRDLDGIPARGRHGGQLPADRGGGQEHRHPRERHPRLRRLLPVPRRDGGDGPGADRDRTQGLRGGLDQRRRRQDPLAQRGDLAGVPGPGGQPALDRRHAAARLQGCVRAGRHRRLPVRLRRHRGRGARLDVRAAGQLVRAGQAEPGLPAAGQPLGADRRSSRSSARPPSAACGRNRTRRR